MRTVIYARYSSALQNSRSIEDQIAVCRDRARREGWEIVEVYTDYAISGAAGINEASRPGLNAMLARVESGGIDQVLAEATDRIARHQGDSFAIRERLTYAGTRLFTLSDGEVTEINGTLKGLMDAQFRKELGAKIKRGQRGSVASGRAPAGLAYGYRVANRIDARGQLVRGLREVDPDQAEIVTRIFREFAAGQSARTIALRLNADGVPGPRGGNWRASTIYGDRIRLNGMLQNSIYVGMLVHNRTSKVVEPVSRKVRIRPNPPEDWVSEAVPALRIIDQALWDAVQEQRGRFEGIHFAKAVRPRQMLSGLGTCGVCGGGWTVVGLDRWGCSRQREGGGCHNNRSIITRLYEERVLGGLREQMLDPDMVAIFVREYHAEYARGAADARRERARVERRLAEITVKVDRLISLIADGGGEFEEFRDMLRRSRAERDALAAELANLDGLPVVALHPTVAADYRRQIEDLNRTLAAGPEARIEAVPILRNLIDRIVVTPSSTPRNVEITIEGRLSAILALASGKPVAERRMFEAERVKGIEPSS